MRMHPDAGCGDHGRQNEAGCEGQKGRSAAHLQGSVAQHLLCYTQHTAMRNALLLFLLTLSGTPGGPATPPASIEPASHVEASASIPSGAIVGVEEVIGAWRGRWSALEGPAVPVEVVFTQGIRPRTAFAYVTFIEGKGERTVRRPAQLTDAGIVFAVPGRGEVVLRAEGGSRLVGPGLTLSRLRR
jgi:hypothetical protein